MSSLEVAAGLFALSGTLPDADDLKASGVRFKAFDLSNDAAQEIRRHGRAGRMCISVIHPSAPNQTYVFWNEKNAT